MTLAEAYVRLFDLAVLAPRMVATLDMKPFEPHTRDGLLYCLTWAACRPEMLAAAREALAAFVNS